MPTLPVNSDLLDAVMNELRIPVTNTVERAKIQTVMNFVYGDVCAKQDWWWLLRRLSDTLSATDATGATLKALDPTLTISLSAGTATGTLSSAPNTSGFLFKGGIWFTDGTPDAGSVYRVLSSYTGGSTTIPLQSVYGGPTASGVGFNIGIDTLNVFASDMAKVLRMTRYGSPYDMKKIGIEEMSQIKQYDKSVGRPQYWTVYDFETSGDPSTDRVIWVHPYPDANYKFDIWYKHQQQGDTSTDLSLPIDYQQVLIYGTLSRCYPIFLNDLERGEWYKSLFNDVMALMAAQQKEYAMDHPGVDPSAQLYRRTGGRNRRTYGTLGKLFDTLPQYF